ncbi:ATP:cob(I)alamin adenosyltransferase [Nocardia anaemiae]|uniref:ATP:cob(I)alamin adenosyltransferase n=1 Tax=Nocardia anaemiae TaxID=263910 RepID=UPI0007A43888|nr:ATP:cob(I)alamin adenosyltransferase [Nocardia anaemiae]
MTALTFGYLQQSLVGARRTEVVEHIEAFAARHGRVVDKIACEPSPSVAVLRSLLEALDRRSGGRALPMLAELARRQGVELDRLLDYRPSTTVFWSLVAELDRAGGGYILTPSPRHLDGLGSSRSVLLHRISQTHPAITVVYTDPAPDQPPAYLDQNHSGVVCQFRVAALGCAVEVATLNAHIGLARAGLGDMVDQVEALLREIIGSAVEFDAETVSEEPNQLTVELVRGPETLRVLTHETRDHAYEPVSDHIHQLCDWPLVGRATRTRLPTGGTLTCCELPLRLYDQPDELPQVDSSGHSDSDRP